MNTIVKSYYDLHPILTRGSVYNFIMGARGLGKTYAAKKHVIKRALSNGEEFIYLRRFNSELKGRVSFFADISGEFPGYEFRVEGMQAQTKRATDKQWTTIGYFAALSKSQSYKSTAYPHVTWIIFDEFILESGFHRYLNNEAKVLNDFYSTVDRWKDKTRVFFLANSISILNPYFQKFNIAPDGREWIGAGNGFITAHFPDSNEFASEVSQTRFGQFITKFDEEYAEFSISSVFKDNSGDLIGTKPADADYWYSINTEGALYSVWKKAPFFYIQQRQPAHPIILTTDPMNVTDTVNLIGMSDPIFATLRRNYKLGNLIFDKPISRVAFVKSFRF